MTPIKQESIMERLIIKTDVTDWGQELVQEEPNIGTDDGIFEELTENKRSTTQMGRFLVAGRAMNRVPEDMIPPNKLLLQSGAMRAVSDKYLHRKKRVQGRDGEYRNVRVAVAIPSEEKEPVNGEEPKKQASREWVAVENERASVAASSYLRNTVGGHIWSRVEIVAMHKGRAAAIEDLEELVTQVKGMINTLK